MLFLTWPLTCFCSDLLRCCSPLPRLHTSVCALRIEVRAPCISKHKLRHYCESPELSKLSGLLLKNSSLYEKSFFWFFLGFQIVVITLQNLRLFLISSGINIRYRLSFSIWYFISHCSVFKVHMVESRGIEPLTSCVQGMRSPSWANSPYPLTLIVQKRKSFP